MDYLTFSLGLNVNIEKDIRYKRQWENNEISRSSIGFRNFSKIISRYSIIWLLLIVDVCS